MTRRTATALLAGAAAATGQSTPAVGMLVYPGMTALDLVGPNQVFGYMMAQVQTVWKSRDPITTDTGLVMTATRTFSDCPEPLDILFVPGGGAGTIALMQDRAVLDFLHDAEASTEP